ncbi:hypothetical protein A7U60_g362 [Sanghuangporus baumii]|uniref:Uncharacterized protein n=1 Tax=Sanghuangporus baumii TaxID=108892 RepID=A0A9Q5I5V4_SANBA|nr:hypothetical protein A7U60_g362 [Sanghuangporus baumii]
MTTFSVRPFACLALILSATGGVFALVACDSGQIALGTIFVHVTIHNVRAIAFKKKQLYNILRPFETQEAAIFDSSCSSLDFKVGGTDDNICGSYSGGSSVDCDASGIPQAGVLSNGTTFGNCVSNVHDCDNINKVQFCCDFL